MKKTNKVAHLTSAHTRYDVRIFLKQCKSLAQKGYDVSLVVADGKGYEVAAGVKIYDVGKLKGRLNRFLRTSRNVYKKAMELGCEIYHLHDPELIPYGLKLRKKGKKVIFDAHEDLPKQLKSKPYLNKLLKKTLPITLKMYENYAFKKFDYLVGATPSITAKLMGINSNSININNFPIIGELDKNVPWNIRKSEISYVGGISTIRGIHQIVDALQYVTTDVKMNLIGGVNEHNLLEKVKQRPGWKKVTYHGILDRVQVSGILSQSKIGIVTFLNAPNHTDAQPNKMFEYMSAGIPIITSNFPLWEEIVEGNRCGVTVNPEDPREIAKAIDNILSNDELAHQMGKNGKAAVLDIYNWKKEEIKLIEMYNHIR